MTDNGDGTYSHTYTISGGSGTATVSVSTQTAGGVYAEYWTNTARSGTASNTRYEGPIDNGWGSGVVTPTSNSDDVGA